MNLLIKKRISTFTGIAVLFTILLLACKKEYVNEKMPYNSIESFTIKGYTGDSVNAVINNGSIIIYWSADAAIPATIKPVITVSPHAAISPASGTEVVFSESTQYTVTAEDGTQQVFHLKPVLDKAIPKISSINSNSLEWITDTQLVVSGEYFLSGDTSDVHVYAQRMSDGFEFDMNIDYKQLTMTNITANLPLYTNMQDTGLHKIWVKIGDRVSDYKIINIRYPDIYYNNVLHLAFSEAGQTMQPGDSLTLKYWDDYNGAVTKWYTQRFTRIVFENYSFEAAALSQTDSTIKFRLPDTPIERKPTNIILYYVDPFLNSNYTSAILSQDQWPVIPVK